MTKQKYHPRNKKSIGFSSKIHRHTRYISLDEKSRSGLYLSVEKQRQDNVEWLCQHHPELLNIPEGLLPYSL